MSKPYEVHLCRGCIEELKEYNPYTTNNLLVVEVPLSECDNTLIDLGQEVYNKVLMERNPDYFPGDKNNRKDVNMTYEEFMKGIEIEGAISSNFKVEAEAAAQYFLDRINGLKVDPTPEVLRNCLKKFIAKRVARKYMIIDLKDPSFEMKVAIWDDYPDILFAEDELDEIFLQAASIRSDLLVKGRL